MLVRIVKERKTPLLCRAPLLGGPVDRNGISRKNDSAEKETRRRIRWREHQQRDENGALLPQPVTTGNSEEEHRVWQDVTHEAAIARSCWGISVTSAAQLTLSSLLLTHVAMVWRRVLPCVGCEHQETVRASPYYGSRCERGDKNKATRGRFLPNDGEQKEEQECRLQNPFSQPHSVISSMKSRACLSLTLVSLAGTERKPFFGNARAAGDLGEGEAGLRLGQVSDHKGLPSAGHSDLQDALVGT